VLESTRLHYVEVIRDKVHSFLTHHNIANLQLVKSGSLFALDFVTMQIVCRVCDLGIFVLNMFRFILG